MTVTLQQLSVLRGGGRRAQLHSGRGAGRGGATDAVAAAQGAGGRAGRAAGGPRRRATGRPSPPAGEAVLPLARRMLADADSARAAVAEIVGLRRGRVRVGATPSLCIGVLADVLRVFHEQHPAIALELAENGSQPLVRSLVRGELDIALVIVPAGRASTRPCTSRRCCGSGCRWPRRRPSRPPSAGAR